MKQDKKGVKQLFDNLKESLQEQPDTPAQTIVPVAKKKEEESPFTLYLPSVRLKKLKAKAVEDEVTMKELINDAILKQYGF
jgi:hypothetical protein